MTSAITSAITMLLILTILPIIVKSVKKKQNPTANQVRMPRFAFWVGIVGTIFFAGLLIVSLLLFGNNALLVLIFGIVFGGFTALGIYEILSAVNWGIDYDDAGFAFRNSLGKSSRFEYADIERVDRIFNPVTQGYKATIHAMGKRIRLDPLCIGAEEFLRHLDGVKTAEQKTLGTTQSAAADFMTEGGIVRMPVATLWVGIVCTAFFAIPLFIMILDPYALLDLGTESVLALVAFVLMGLFLLLQYFNWRIDYDARGFQFRNSLGKKDRFSYSDIQSRQTETRNLVLFFGNRKLQFPLNAKGMYEFRKHVDRALGTTSEHP